MNNEAMKYELLAGILGWIWILSVIVALGLFVGAISGYSLWLYLGIAVLVAIISRSLCRSYDAARRTLLFAQYLSSCGLNQGEILAIAPYWHEVEFATLMEKTPQKIAIQNTASRILGYCPAGLQ